MDGESTDSEHDHDNYRGEGGAADEDKILSVSVQASGCSGTHATSRLREANGLSVYSGTTY
jgi:hypothetical protein